MNKSGVISVDESPDVTVVSFCGELDATNAREVEEAVAGAVQRRLPVILDVSGVSFVDSSGVRSLIVPGQTSSRVVVLVIPPENGAVSRVFDLLPFPWPFERAAERDEAVRRVSHV